MKMKWYASATWLVFGSLIGLPSVAAQYEIVCVEEDWELEVAHPDTQLDAPQLTVSMAPFSSAPSLHLQVNFNYALKPDFSAGGVQLRVAHGDAILGHVHRLAGSQLAHQNELIRWTSAVQKTDAGYLFGVHSGSSQSWGAFGGGSYALSIPQSITGGSLAGYSVTNSLQNSGTTYASNRVAALRLIRVRLIDASGGVQEIPVNVSVQ